MRSFLGVMCIIIFSSFATGCVDPEEVRRENQKQLQLEANRIVENMGYIKDTRTGFCFAFHRGTGGPSLATVPCQGIPSQLLVVSE